MLHTSVGTSPTWSACRCVRNTFVVAVTGRCRPLKFANDPDPRSKKKKSRSGLPTSISTDADPCALLVNGSPLPRIVTRISPSPTRSSSGTHRRRVLPTRRAHHRRQRQRIGAALEGQLRHLRDLGGHPRTPPCWAGTSMAEPCPSRASSTNDRSPGIPRMRHDMGTHPPPVDPGIPQSHRPRLVHAHPHAIEDREHPGIRAVQSAIVGTDPGNARRVRPLHLDGVLGARRPDRPRRHLLDPDPPTGRCEMLGRS